MASRVLPKSGEFLSLRRMTCKLNKIRIYCQPKTFPMTGKTTTGDS